MAFLYFCNAFDGTSTNGLSRPFKARLARP